MDTFGEFLYNRRREQRINLRRFCEMASIDSSNYSKMERGKLSAPKDENTRKRMRLALGIEDDTLEAREFERLAAFSQGRIPPQLLSNDEIARRLPAFFRTLEGEEVSDKMVEELVKIIRDE